MTPTINETTGVTAESPVYQDSVVTHVILIFAFGFIILSVLLLLYSITMAIFRPCTNPQARRIIRLPPRPRPRRPQHRNLDHGRPPYNAGQVVNIELAPLPHAHSTRRSGGREGLESVEGEMPPPPPYYSPV